MRQVCVFCTLWSTAEPYLKSSCLRGSQLYTIKKKEEGRNTLASNGCDKSSNSLHVWPVSMSVTQWHHDFMPTWVCNKWCHIPYKAAVLHCHGNPTVTWSCFMSCCCQVSVFVSWLFHWPWLPHSDTITANSEPRTVSLALWLLMNHRETLHEMITIIHNRRRPRVHQSAAGTL